MVLPCRPPDGDRPRPAYTHPVRVDQVIPSLASRDAIGTHTITLMHALRAAGLESDVFYGACTPDLAGTAKPVTALGRHARDRVLLYQASIGSPVFDILLARTEPVLVHYHNITPAELLAPWEPDVAFETALGRAQLERLAPRAHLAVGVSAFDERELIDAGYTRTAVAPLLVDMSAPAGPPDRAAAARLARDKSAGGPDLLFVGKISPHKAPHDLVKMLYVYRRVYDPRARLRLVGAPLGESYAPALEAFADEIGLGEAVDVAGSVDTGTLEAYYAAADAFVCASEHEGFCAPLVEAMSRGVPVVAFGTAAVPETVGGAGLVLPDKDPLRFAAAVHRVVTDAALRHRLHAAALDRVAAFELGRATARHVELVVEAAASALSGADRCGAPSS